MVTLTDEESERIFGSIRSEYQLDLMRFNNERELQSAMNQILTRGKQRNLGRGSKMKLKGRAGEYFDTEYVNAHRNATRRIREKRTRKLFYRRGDVINRRWTQKEINFLRNTYRKKDVTAQQIARNLNRSPKSVYRKAEQLKLKKKKIDFTDLEK